MLEEEKRMEWRTKHYNCDQCGKEVFQSENEEQDKDGNFLHKCSDCPEEIYLPKVYPFEYQVEVEI